MNCKPQAICLKTNNPRVIVRLEACRESPEAGKNVFAGKATFALKFESLS